MTIVSLYFMGDRNAVMYTGEDDKPHIMTVTQGEAYLQNLYKQGYKREKNHCSDLDKTLYVLSHY